MRLLKWALPLMLAPTLLAAQAPATPAPAAPLPPSFSILAGIGNPMGWFGAQAERYFTNERLSLFFGLGYTPAIDSGDPKGVTVAGGFRAYTSGQRHRVFAEASVSQIVIVQASRDARLYGPGVQLGYQYMARRGFTADISLGFGYAIGADDVYFGSRVEPIVALGFGHTWRRNRP